VELYVLVVDAWSNLVCELDIDQFVLDRSIGEKKRMRKQKFNILNKKFTWYNPTYR